MADESVERAALRHWEAEGWTGCAAEGGLFLTLLKAASFDVLPSQHKDTFIESLYHWEFGGFPRLETPRAWMLENVRTASDDRIASNYGVIAGEGLSPAYYPGVHLSDVLKFRALLGDKFIQAAEIFAAAPYEFRRGWPDLTIWQGEELQLLEVKAPGDAIQASQKKVIADMLKPLGLRVSIVEVLAS